jgi:hypothetical protein
MMVKEILMKKVKGLTYKKSNLGCNATEVLVVAAYRR